MVAEQYRKAIREVYDRIDETQMEAMEKAAEMIVEAVQKGGSIHVYDTGHIINSELINRAGGLAMLRALTYSVSVNNDVRTREDAQKERSMEGLSTYILRQSNVMPGDVLILGSVSGKTVRVIDMALAARELGVKTIAVTSLAYSSALQSDHSSGKRLFEVCDHVINNCAPKGDAMIACEGLENPFGPASGLGSAYIMWQISAMITDKLLAAGLQPTVLKSINFPGGPENLAKCEKRYKEIGY